MRAQTMVLLVFLPCVARAAGPAPAAGGLVPMAAGARDISERAGDDPLFPGGGHVSVGVGSGIPYLGIAEVAFGFGDRIALGIVGGATPYVVGAGLRFRASIVDGDTTRLLFRMSGLYYGGSQIASEPWILIMPSLLVETRLGTGARLWGGIGAAGAGCIDDLGELIDGGMMGGPWGTVTAGASLPFGGTATAFVEASLITRGVAVPDSWVGGPPVVLLLGVTRAF